MFIRKTSGHLIKKPNGTYQAAFRWQSWYVMIQWKHPRHIQVLVPRAPCAPCGRRKWHDPAEPQGVCSLAFPTAGAARRVRCRRKRDWLGAGVGWCLFGGYIEVFYHVLQSFTWYLMCIILFYNIYIIIYKIMRIYIYIYIDRYMHIYTAHMYMQLYTYIIHIYTHIYIYIHTISDTISLYKIYHMCVLKLFD